MHIRQATEHDLEAIIGLMKQLDAAAVITLEDARRVFTSHIIYVAQNNDEIVGTFTLAIIQQLSHNGGCSAIIEDVIVREDQHGQGIGRQMMQFAAEEAKARGCYKILLSSAIYREAAHHFYDEIGYQRHGISFRLELKS